MVITHITRRGFVSHEGLSASRLRQGLRPAGAIGIGIEFILPDVDQDLVSAQKRKCPGGIVRGKSGF